MSGDRRGLVAVVAGGLLLTVLSPRPVRAGLLVTAADDAYAVVHDHVLSVAAPGVLGNDSGLLPTAAKLTNPAHGTVTVSADGSFTYRPTAGYVGADSFTYEARVLSLGILLTDPATVRITVTNVTPVATDDTYSATTGVQLTVAGPGVLGNDDDADGDTLTAIKMSDSGSGSVNLSSNGGFTFTSGGSFTGARTFTYRAFDGVASSNLATVTINVSAAAPTPTPTPTPNPTATPAPTPTPTAPQSDPPGPVATPTPTSTRPPAPSPTAGPSTTGGGNPGATASPTGSPSSSPGAGATAGPSIPAPTGSPGPGAIGTTGTTGGPPPGGSGPGQPAVDRGALDVGGSGSAAGALDPIDVLGALGLGSLLDWAVPALVLTVPGLLLVLAVLAQMAGGLIWLPLVRRWLGGLGVRRRRSGAAP